MTGAVQVLAVEVVIGAVIAVAAVAALARQAWRELVATRARHDRLVDALGDTGWWHG